MTGVDENTVDGGRPRVAAWKRLLPPVITVVIFYFIFRRVPFARFLLALERADYAGFFSLMIPNSMVYFALDTLVLAWLVRWFHGPIRYGELLPARAVTYVVSLMNTHLARGALAYYLTRQVGMPFFQLASTVVFLWLVELTHLALWTTAGMAVFARRVPAGLFWVPLGFVLFWLVFLFYVKRGVAGFALLERIRAWSIMRTFRRAEAKHYVQVILLRAVMFSVALVFHFFAVKTFGINIPLGELVAFLPIVFMLASLPITVAHLGTTQAAWIFFFNRYAEESQLLAYSLSSHLAFMLGRALLGLVFLPRAYKELFEPLRRAALAATRPAASE
ncbi:MAG: flippase-like domain-containing protein [Acidobacteria bacterium]|nr:flippase-like domain-containing protein [Acidobacteriota bacterium]